MWTDPTNHVITFKTTTALITGNRNYYTYNGSSTRNSVSWTYCTNNLMEREHRVVFTPNKSGMAVFSAALLDIVYYQSIIRGDTSTQSVGNASTLYIMAEGTTLASTVVRQNPQSSVGYAYGCGDWIFNECGVPKWYGDFRIFVNKDKDVSMTITSQKNGNTSSFCWYGSKSSNCIYVYDENLTIDKIDVYYN